MPLFGEQRDAVGGEQLVVADRRRDRARARARGAQSGLHVVIAVAAGLERIDPHDLLARQPGRQCDAAIGALELDLAGGPLRRKLEMRRGGFQEIGDHRKRLALAGLVVGLRIHRPLRPVVQRRLRQDIIIERDGLALAPLGVAAAPFFGNRGPVGFGFLLERGARRLIFLQLAAIFRDRLRRRRLRHRIRRRRRQRVHGQSRRRTRRKRERDKAQDKDESIARRMRPV